MWDFSNFSLKSVHVRTETHKKIYFWCQASTEQWDSPVTCACKNNAKTMLVRVYSLQPGNLETVKSLKLKFAVLIMLCLRWGSLNQQSRVSLDLWAFNWWWKNYSLLTNKIFHLISKSTSVVNLILSIKFY